MSNLKTGFMPMILSILGVVLYVTMFSTVMTGLTTLAGTSGVSNFIALSTVIGIAPTVLFLGGVFAAGLVYWKGYKNISESGGDPGGLMRMVVGVLIVILFITLFATIVTAVNTLYTTYSSNTSWIAFGTVMSIAPTVLFLGGIFAGTGTAVAGYRARKSRRTLR